MADILVCGPAAHETRDCGAVGFDLYLHLE